MLPVASSDPAVLWPLGHDVSLGDDPRVRGAMIAGWAQPEGPHIWNDGPESQMQVTVAEPQRALTVTFAGIPLIHPQRPFQELTLFVNGYRLGFWRLHRADISRLSATLEPEQMRVRGSRTHAVLNIAWHLPLSVRPAALGAGSDSRELGFCFHTLKLA